MAGQKCFHLRASLHVLDHDGNLVDASCLALIAALLHFRRPDIEVHGEDVKIFSPEEREPARLTIQHRPFCVSFSYFDGGEVVLQDATLLEEQVREGEVVVGMNKFGEVCQVAKYGGVSVDGLSLLGCTTAALERVKAFDKLVTEGLREDEERRMPKGMAVELSAENERIMEPPVG